MSQWCHPTISSSATPLSSCPQSYPVQFSSVQSLNCVRLLVTPCSAARQASLSITNSQSLLKLMSLHWWCHPTISSSVIPFSPCLQSFWVSGSKFQWVSSLYQVAKVLELQLQQQPTNEYSELISFRISWFDHHAIQGTLKSLLQHHNSKASVLCCSAFFMI